MKRILVADDEPSMMPQRLVLGQSSGDNVEDLTKTENAVVPNHLL